MAKKDEDMAGALWKKVSKKNGKPYLGGSVKIKGVVYWLSVFENNFRVTDKSPDYNVMVSEQEPQGQSWAEMQEGRDS